MKDKLFKELCASIRQMGRIRRGEMKPSRSTVIETPREVRRKLKLSQSEFARLLRVSKFTLQNWEQGRRKPEGPARALLVVAAKHPDAVLDALHGKAS